MISKADEETFPAHAAWPHSSTECCVSCAVYVSTFVLRPKTLKAPTEQISPQRPTFFPYSLISSLEVDENLFILQ